MKAFRQMTALILTAVVLLGSSGLSFHKVLCLRSNLVSMDLGVHQCEHEPNGPGTYFTQQCCDVNQFEISLEYFVKSSQNWDSDQWLKWSTLIPKSVELEFVAQPIPLTRLNLPPPDLVQPSFTILYQSFLC